MSKYSPFISTRNYRGLCLGAGGVKGIIQAGALHAFWTRGQLDSLKYFAGSSVGSVLCFLIAIGYSPIEILTASCSPDFAAQFASVNFMNLKTISGLFPSSIMRDKLEEMTKLKLGYLPTFSDLYNRMGKFLIITTYCLSDPDRHTRKIYCSPHATPNMNVIDAIIMSTAIPIIFQRVTYGGKIYIDGAFTSLFPLKALQETMINEPGPVLGMYNRDFDINCSTLLGYIKEVIYISIREQDNFSTITELDDVLELVSKDSGLNFTLTVKDRVSMFASGNIFASQCLSLASRVPETNEQHSNDYDKINNPESIESVIHDKQD